MTNSIPRVLLGKSDLNVPTLCLGGNVFGWTVPESEAFRQLDAALEAGLNFIDTADVYSRWAPGNQGGESETILGKWFAKSGKRKDVILATKVGMDMGEGKSGLKPAYIEQAVEASLRRLQTDAIDLYQAHRDDESTPLEETLAAFDKLVKAGKVRYIGASNYKGARLAEALKVSRDNGLAAYVSLQPHYSLVERKDFESDLLPVVEQHKLGVIPYFSLASGFLTGKYHSKTDAEGQARAGMVGKYLNDRGFAVVSALEEVAEAHQSTPARVALAWLIAQPGITAPIASATKEKHLTDLVEATKLSLSKGDIEKLNTVSNGKIAE
ncbi:aldo/keto reductase [Silvibacterium dinghuense]|uniref:Aldo/keto reductase n=1 Tax=Silvibacterium dinghuense TaxID=1560006 RepID=A0A4Q1SIM0_9BACT|nr:aldo/keto reductase [Silvibacterium dinghuense]RXS97461.1 aldo/keto reductase [Silvibacterium dinghuense]GGG99213.1 oxidoreductase [Silvibacterium dinghuense]